MNIDYLFDHSLDHPRPQKIYRLFDFFVLSVLSVALLDYILDLKTQFVSHIFLFNTRTEQNKFVWKWKPNIGPALYGIASKACVWSCVTKQDMFVWNSINEQHSFVWKSITERDIFAWNPVAEQSLFVWNHRSEQNFFVWKSITEQNLYHTRAHNGAVPKEKFRYRGEGRRTSLALVRQLPTRPSDPPPRSLSLSQKTNEHPSVQW